MKIAWDREDASFINVVAVVLWYPPLYNNPNIWSALVTAYYVTLHMETEPSFYYRIVICCNYLFLDKWALYLFVFDIESDRRSRICSLYIYRNEAFTINYAFFSRYFICVKIYWITRGMMPRVVSFSIVETAVPIVNVLPPGC